MEVVRVVEPCGKHARTRHLLSAWGTKKGIFDRFSIPSSLTLASHSTKSCHLVRITHAFFSRSTDLERLETANSQSRKTIVKSTAEGFKDKRDFSASIV